MCRRHFLPSNSPNLKPFLLLFLTHQHDLLVPYCSPQMPRYEPSAARLSSPITVCPERPEHPEAEAAPITPVAESDSPPRSPDYVVGTNGARKRTGAEPLYRFFGRIFLIGRRLRLLRRKPGDPCQPGRPDTAAQNSQSLPGLLILVSF